MNKQKRERENKRIYFVTVLMFLFVLLGGCYLIKNLFFSNAPITEIQACKQSYIIESAVNAYGRNSIDKKVDDWYVIEKKISENYWYKICKDLLKIRLNETLNKSDNLFLEPNFPFFDDDNYQLDCKYNIFWDDNVGYYGNIIESGEIGFDTVDVLLAQEKRQPKYNQSLIEIFWDEELETTRIKNDNNDYDVLLNLKLNESVEVC